MDRELCPGCSPEFDSENDVCTWCPTHRPQATGSEDIVVSFTLPSGTAESGGGCNREWNDLFYKRGKFEERQRRKKAVAKKVENKMD